VANSGEVARLLRAREDGDSSAFDRLVPLVYEELRRLARRQRRRGPPGRSLDTTGLVHEAYMKIAASGSAHFENRAHFFATTARAMRQVLINYAEKRSAQKRGGGAKEVTLYEGDAVTDNALEELLALNAALEKLSAMSERQAQVVECLFFAGLGIEETADALEISPATVKRDWSTARAWLYREMSGGTP